MSSTAPLAQHRYDALDRLVATSTQQRFYCLGRLRTEVQGTASRSLFEHADQPLAQRTERLSLLATEPQGSVILALAEGDRQALAYSPYGHRPHAAEASLLGFNRERPEPLTGHYLLGNGYRALMPALGRFNSPDSWSPFGKGGLNAYAYCQGDPVNRVDPSGHGIVGKLLSTVGKKLSQSKTTALHASKKPTATALGQSPMEQLPDLALKRIIEHVPPSERGNLAASSRIMGSRVQDLSPLPVLTGGHSNNPATIAQVRTFYRTAPPAYFPKLEQQLIERGITPSAKAPLSYPRNALRTSATTSFEELQWKGLLAQREDIRNSIARVDKRLGTTVDIEE